jgi:hypothetical protein
VDNESSVPNTHSKEYKCHGFTGGSGIPLRQSLGTEASNESIVPTHDGRLVWSFIEMEIAKKNLPQYYNIHNKSRRTILGLNLGEVKAEN